MGASGKIARALCALVTSGALLALTASGAFAADESAPVGKAPAPPPAPANPFDVALQLAATMDYVSRGITLSAHKPAAGFTVEPKYQWLYSGIALATIKLAFRSPVEVDLYAGIRPMIGPLIFDVRFTYYHFPDAFLPGTNIGARYDFWEVIARPTWVISESLIVAGALIHSPNFFNTGASELYFGGSVVVRRQHEWLPAGAIAHASVEVAHLQFGTTTTGVKLPDYTTWNVGVGLTYKGVLFDFRYHDTTLTRENCAVLTADQSATPGGTPSPANPLGFRSNWCGTAFVARVAFDTTLSALR
jgi:uncharacterized protein (TIGR02001 family)